MFGRTLWKKKSALELRMTASNRAADQACYELGRRVCAALGVPHARDELSMTATATIYGFVFGSVGGCVKLVSASWEGTIGSCLVWVFVVVTGVWVYAGLREHEFPRRSAALRRHAACAGVVAMCAALVWEVVRGRWS